jgi:hypothetical protein
MFLRVAKDHRLRETMDFSGSTRSEQFISAGIDLRYVLDVEVVGHAGMHFRPK